MVTGKDLVLDLEEQLNTIKLPLMALKLDELFRSPDYPAIDKLDFLSILLAPEVRDKVSKVLQIAYVQLDCDLFPCQRVVEPGMQPFCITGFRKQN